MQPALSTGFPPLARNDARVLVLGSLPGVASLQAARYYAHPRNAFWPIMGDLLGFSPQDAYDVRVAALLDAHIAVWDVVAQGARVGSLDADIRREQLRVNDFLGFFGQHPQIRCIFFNGRKAQELFERQVLPMMTGGMARVLLPSTSPAHAGMGLAAKREAWRQVVEAARGC